MDQEQLRLAPDLLAVMRTGVDNAIERGAQFVFPPHLLLALLDEPTIGSAVEGHVNREKVEKAAEAALAKLPEVTELPEGSLPDDEKPPFQRYDTLAFTSRDGHRTMYLDHDAYHLFLEGARRANEVYKPKHLLMGFVAASVKDGEILALLGPDPQRINRDVSELETAATQQ